MTETGNNTGGDAGAGTRAPIPDEYFRLLLESVRDYAIFLLDPSGHVATWSAGAETIKGYRASEIIGEHIATFYADDDRHAHKPERLLATALAEGRVEDEGWRVRKDGSRFWADVIITALRDATGQHVGFAKVTRDLTNRMLAEEKLRHAEELLKATLYSIADAVLATDECARVTIINPVAERLTGWREQEAVGRPVKDVFDIVNEQTRTKAFNPVARVLSEGVVVGLANHTALISRDGAERPIADSGAPIRDAQGRTRGAVLVFRDVTEERRAEESIRQSEERLRLMIGSVHDYAIYFLDASGRVATWNPGAETIKGYREDEIVGEHFSRFFTPEDVAAGKPARALEVTAKEGRFEEETWRVKKDGSRFWANVVISAVRDGSGQLMGFAKVTRDLTERRKAEDERVRLAQAHESVRLRDEFLSIASHELKTPLTALQLQLEALLDRVSGEDRLEKKVDKAVRASRRLADLIETLLDVSRIATGQLTLDFETFDLVDVAREVIERLRDAAVQGGCELSLKQNGPVVGSWDRIRIEQIVTNLLANAVKFASGTPVVVTVKRDGDAALLDVRDSGPGIREEDLGRIFERFERASSPAPSGMGLGLYITRQVAEAHGGTIGAQNLAAGGACFILRLPLAPAVPPHGA
ncbi:MAG TPA: PAS domain S-box protein [Polyangiaceae bacterium]